MSTAQAQQAQAQQAQAQQAQAQQAQAQQAQAQQAQIQKKTFRFEFTADIMDLIKRFAIVHQYDERKMYKEQWNNWYNENKEEMEREIERMNEIGYVGDVQDKMFKAGRYYFRKKNIKNKEKTENKEVQTQYVKHAEVKHADVKHADVKHADVKHADVRPHVVNASVVKEKPQRNYITMLEETLAAMDEHIKTSLANDADFKPSDGYSKFCENNVFVLRTEIQRMVGENIMDKKDIPEKIKKTYKNRYYMLTRN
jgi:hypothetical protein